MTAAILSFTFIFLIILAAVLRVVIRAKDTAGRRSLHAIDVAAFRNLLRKEDDLFLGKVLSGRSYRQVRRARVRAIQEYLIWIAENCLTLQLQISSLATDQALASAPLHSFIRSAMRMRFIALGSWLWLWSHWVFPGIDRMPTDIAGMYGDLARKAAQLNFEANALLVNR